MSPSCRRANVALIATFFLGRSLPGQGAPDSIKQQSVIDAATAVRERGARSVADILTSQVPGLLVVPASGVNGMGSRIRLRGVQSLVADRAPLDRKSTRLNSSHGYISYAVFCLKKKKQKE